MLTLLKKMNIRKRLFSGFSIALLVSLFQLPAYAAKNYCSFVTTILKKELQYVGNNPTLFEYYDKGGIRYILAFAKKPYKKLPHENIAYAKWFLLKNKVWNRSQFCLVAKGNTFQPLLSIEDAPYSGKKFGIPGSGYTRCTSGIDDELAMRIWANKELGKSIIWSLPSKLQKNVYYTIMAGEDLNWIVIKGTKRESCYDDVGEKFKAYPNYSLQSTSYNNENHPVKTDNKSRDSSVLSHLMQAAADGNLKMVKALLAHGAKVNLAGIDGLTALGTAVLYSHLDITEYLLSKGANVNIRSRKGVTPLMRAAHNGNLQIAKVLLDHGAKVNLSDIYGFTALSYSVGKGHLNMAKYLLYKGANAKLVPKKRQMTPLMQAAYNGNLQIIKVLLNNGAKVNLTDNGITALNFAIVNGHFNIVKYLLSKGANVNLKIKKGTTSLMLAVEKENFAIVNLLIKNNADINSTNKEGITALMFAALKGYLPTVKALVMHGADVNAIGKDNITALFFARAENHWEIANYLLAHGAS